MPEPCLSVPHEVLRPPRLSGAQRNKIKIERLEGEVNMLTHERDDLVQFCARLLNKLEQLEGRRT